MSKKIDRAHYGPSWTEVILGAVLSVALGGLLAALFLVFKPVTAVKTLPEKPTPGMVYYIEGSHDANKARKLAAKQSAFLKGNSIELNEDELNIAMVPANPPPAAKGAAPKTPEPEASTSLAAGTPNFHLDSGKMQISAPVRAKVALVGLDASFLMQTRGSFAKEGGIFVFQPETIMLGSCPVHRIPVVKGLVLKKIMNANVLPADLSAAWAKLSDVTIEGSTLKLGAPKS